MPNPLTLNAVVELATQLPPSDQKQLAETILQQLASRTHDNGARRRAWREIRGSVPYPLCGQDAQDWVSQGRQESEEQREQQWRTAR